MKHYFNEGKEILNQGRSKKQMESSYIGVAIGVVGMVLTLGYLIIFS